MNMIKDFENAPVGATATTRQGDKTMTTYEMPKDPKRDVWDRDGKKWTYSAESGAYRRECGDIKLPYWWRDLLNEGGPLTDTRTPEVGEEFVISSDDDCDVFEYPIDSVYISKFGGVAQYHDGGFLTIGSDERLPSLWSQTWRRIA